MYLVISLLVLRAGYGIWLYQFLIIAYLFYFDFPTLYTTIPHDKLKSRLKDLITHCFFYSNGKRRYKYIVLGHQKTYFANDHSVCTTKFTETDIVSMLEFVLDTFSSYSTDKYSNRRLAFQWVLTVPHYLMICFFIRMRRSSSKDFWSLARKNLPGVSIPHKGHKWYSFSEQF